MFKDYYRILDVSPTATPQEIKSAYRQMSRKWHPDRNLGRDVTAIMQDINEAYAILKDPEKRNRYDIEYASFKQSTSSYDQGTCAEKSTHSQQRWEYDYEVKNETVREDIRNARTYAQKIVAEFMTSMREVTSDAASGAWGSLKGFLLGLLILSLVGLVLQLIIFATR